MSRVKTPNGKRVLLAVKVSEGTAAAVDSARGDLLPAQWLRNLIDAALEAEGISQAPIDSLPPQIPAVKTARRKSRANGHRPPVAPPSPSKPPAGPPPRPPAPPPGAAVFQDAGAERVVTDAPPAPAATRTKCPHPGTRMIGGFCPTCEHLIEPGGYWRE
jgi:hypothetical protein